MRARNAAQLAPLPVFGRGAVSSPKVVKSGGLRLAELFRSDLRDSQGGASEVRKGQKRG